MTKQAQDIAYFLSFCIEQYKNEKGISGETAMRRLSDSGVLDYLSQNFEVLHTQSRQWLMEEIEEYMNSENKETTI